MANYGHAREAYSVDGRYKGRSAQGMAIYADKAFLLNDGGLCRVYDLEARKVVAEFPLGSAGKNNHANCASFGAEFYEDGDEFPLLYVSECRKPYRCFVERVTADTSRLVQTIVPRLNGAGGVAHDWVADRKRRVLYAVARNVSSKAEDGSFAHVVTKFRLPLAKEGSEVCLTEKDVISRFEVRFPNLLQGGTLRGRYLYLPVGLHKGNEKRTDSERAVIKVDLKKGRIVEKEVLTDWISNEPEDADFYKRKLWLYCGQSGGIYPINIK